MTKKCSVLVLEDEAIVAMEIEERLSDLGYEVVAVVSRGEDAIAKSIELEPDIAILDIRLNGTLSGIDAAKEIHLSLNIPVIFLTAYSDDDTLEKAQATEPFAYLIKPFTGRELHTSIEIALFRHKMEQRLRNAAETAMLYIDLMGHDLRQALQAISTGSEILESLTEDDDFRQILEIIHVSVGKAERLISKVLATRQLLETPLTVVDFREVLSRTLDELASDFESVDIQVVYGVSKAQVIADKHLVLLVMNLLENSVLHSNAENKRVWVELAPSDGGFNLTIKDNGPGIPDVHKETLFDPNRRFGGVGLHQSIKIIQKYSGRITVKDRVEGDYSQGAEFCAWLPIAPKSDAPP